ncbi:MAG: gliding motility-associated C-terminal domain-containing protein [Bacteroidota bacterium]
MKSNFTYPTKLLSLFLLYFFSVSICAQSAYDCNNCSANDVSITSVELLSTTPNPAYNSVTNPNVDKYLPLPASCNDGQIITGYLKVNISQNATTRYGLQVEGDIYVDAISSGSFANCDSSLFVSGTRDKFYLDGASNLISWTCGTKLELKKTFVGWGNSSGHNACNDICGIGPHCNKPNANFSFVVITPLSVNFGYSSSCPIEKTAETYSFNALDALNGTTGGVQPYISYNWTIVKNATLIANLSGSSITYDFSQAGAGSGTYTVTLTVIDSNSPATTSSKSTNINVASCCVKSATCKLSDINLQGCSIPAALTNPSDVFIYEACGDAVSVQYNDVGDILICQDGDGADFFRTYTLLYDNVVYKTCTQHIIINDSTPPVVNAVNGSSTVQCLTLAIPPSVPTATDNCAGILTGVLLSTVDTPSSITCEGTRIYTYRYTDTCGNSSDWKYTYTIDHTTVAVVPANGASTIQCLASATTPTPPTVVDICGTNVAAVFASTVDAPLSLTCEGTRTYNYTYTDCSGLVSNWAYIYTIEKGDFTMPQNAGSTVACTTAISAPSVPIVTDDCGNTLTASAPVISNSPSCEGNVTYTYTFTDCEGNTHDWVYTYTIERADFTMPQNAGSTVVCNASVSTPSVPIVTDNCGNTLTASAPVISQTPSCEGNVTYTYTFTDCEGNTHDWVYTYTIERADFTMPQNAGSMVACNTAITAPSVPIVIDNCGNTLTASAPVISATPVCEGNVTYTYTFTDCEGNTHDWVYTYTIERADFTMPQNASSTVACAAAITAPLVPEVTDNCGNILTASVPVISQTPICEGDVTYTYTFNDCEGNTHDWVYTYIIERADFTMPQNASSTVACNASVSTPSVPEVTDNCGNTLTASAPVVSNSPSCEGNINYTYTFTDCEGNTHDWVYTYIIETADFTMPENTGTTVTCAALITTPSVPEVRDNCGNLLNPSNPIISSTPNCEGDITYTYTFTDCKGNTHDWIYTYTIDDTIAPTATTPQNISGLQCMADIPVTNILVVTDEADNCSGTVNVSVADSNNQGSGCKGNPYIITRTYTLTDCSGNSTDLVQTITVEDDTVPTFTAPADTEIFTSASCTYDASVELTGDVINEADNCSSELNATFSDAITETCKVSKIITRTWSLIDKCGNKAENQVQTITVSDKIVPTFTAPANTEIFTTASCTYDVSVEFTGDVTDEADNCSTGLNATFSDSMVAANCEGSKIITRTWSLVDKCGNQAENQIQIITISDKTAPTWTTEIDFLNTTVECSDTTALETAQAKFPVATDNCDLDVTNIIKTTGQFVANEGCANSGRYTNTWTVTDACGNLSAEFTQIITIEDKTPPVIVSCTTNQSIATDSNCQAIVPDFTSIVVTDNCSSPESITVTQSPVAGNVVQSGTTSIIVTAKDACGNQTSCEAQLIITNFIVANDDVGSAVNGYTGGTAYTNVLSNDLLNCGQATTQNVTISFISSTHSGITLSGTDVVIAPGTPAGPYSLVYQICEIANPENCDTATVTLTVNTPAINAIDDNAGPIVGVNQTIPNVINVFTNDTLNGFPVIPSEVTLTTPNDNPFLHINPDGSVDVLPNAPEGPQTVTYQICEVVNPENCDSAIVTVIIERPTMEIIANAICIKDVPYISYTATPGNFNPVDGLTITWADSNNNIIATMTNLPLSGQVLWPGAIVDPNGNGMDWPGWVFENNMWIEKADGFENLRPTATLTFTLNPSETIVVNYPPADPFCTSRPTFVIDAVDDAAGTNDGANGVPNIVNVFINDMLNNVAVNPADVTLTTITPSNNLNLNADGSVDLIPGTQAGIYTLTYQICENANEGNCDQAVVTITVALPAMSISAPIINRTVNCDATSLAINLLENVTMNEIPVTINMVNISLTSGNYPNIVLIDLGSLNVDNGIPVGEYKFVFSVCDKINPDNCTVGFVNITVQDITAPTIAELPHTKTISCTAPLDFEQAVGSDSCGEVILSSSDEIIAGNCVGSYTITRTWTATDSSGNTATASQTIIVEDKVGPTTTTELIANIDVSCDAVPAKPELVFVDNCSAVGNPAYTEIISNQTLNNYTITREWNVADTCGNNSKFVQIINVNIQNGGVSVRSTACNADSTPIDLSSLLPQGSPVNGIWINASNIGTLEGSIFNPLNAPTGDYIFEYRIINGDCPTSIQINMNINFDCQVLGCEAVVVHNALSPNWDGVNDKLVIDGVEDNLCYPSGIAVEIYNRWGVLVFETNKYNNETNAFEGYSKGRTTINKSDGLPAGTYFYIVNYESFDESGNIQINKKDGFLYLAR